MIKLKTVSVLLYSTWIIFHCVSAQTEWVWGKNRNDNGSGGQGGSIESGLVPVNTVNIFGNANSGGFGGGGSGDRNPTGVSPSQQPTVVVQVLQPGGKGSTGGSSSTSNALPTNSIRSSSSADVQPVNGEARLFTRQIRRFVQNAVNNLSGGNANSITSSSGGGSSPSNYAPGGLLGALLALGPNFIGNRYPPISGGLPISSSEFNTEGNGGSSSSSSNRPNRPNRPIFTSPSNSGGGGSSGGRVCACITDDQCRLPSVVMGSCSSGVMCCRSSGARIIGDEIRRDRNRDTSSSNTRTQTAEIRAGLFGEIVRGTSNVIDDALDLILAPFLTQEDQQQLASRLGTSSSRKNERKI